MDKRTYGEMELSHLGEVTDVVKIKIISNGGATRWINVDPDKFRRIAEVIAEVD